MKRSLKRGVFLAALVVDFTRHSLTLGEGGGGFFNTRRYFADGNRLAEELRNFFKMIFFRRRYECYSIGFARGTTRSSATIDIVVVSDLLIEIGYIRY